MWRKTAWHRSFRDLATGWSWSEEGTELTLPLRRGVKWHDGKPFTAKDVKCTWDLLTGRSAEKLRLNPRKTWYSNLEEVTASGEYEVTFHLKRPQPSILALLASGWSPVYPCHVSPRDMRAHPIGTGPFKFVEFRPNERIRVARNPEYWKPGRPYLSRHGETPFGRAMWFPRTVPARTKSSNPASSSGESGELLYCNAGWLPVCASPVVRVCT
jgi:ABC-type transport system substrate-binding protein